ncbi:MAG: response regulator [Candidatus Aminicenantes bacterium]|nr:response regulator [Candidatus Aminicenantes bacterium]NIN23220.1 response regulator [Candidatus Aminicenantes bacterium]NIN46914.1 response regulator [Candidatus Aminicenantes bacterium]NIN89836.1 response regulator [Candidatus Aminicenantes bacterium]NIO86425.1 response regulator [Candidatus Aminicenantes bacterium]
MRSGVFLATALLLFLTVSAFSQSFLVHQYTEADGLPSSMVYDVTQDHTGRLWFATRKGIAVYDGVHWKHYSTSEGLPASSFINIKVDSRNRIWALSGTGQMGAHVIFYNGETWNNIPKVPLEYNRQEPLPSFELLEIEMEAGAHVLIAVGTRDMGLLLWDGRQWNPLTTGNGLLSNKVNGVVALGGKFYAAAGKGLSIIEINETNGRIRVDNRLNAISIPSPEIKAINLEWKDRFANSPLKHTRLWLCGDQWLGYIEENDLNQAEPKVHIYQRSGLTLPGRGIRVNLFPDYQNGIYITQFLGVSYFNYNTGTVESMGVKNELINDGANSVFVDFEKNVWLCSFRGVSKIASRRFGSFQVKHGLLEDEVTAVLEYAPGKFVFGHNTGLTFYNMTGSPVFKTQPFPWEDTDETLVQRVLDMKADSKNSIWAVLAGDQLIKTNEQGDFKRYGKQEGLAASAQCIWIDPDDTVWLGTSRGVYIMKSTNHRFTPLELEPGVKELKNQSIRRIYKPSNHMIYFTTSRSGVYAYNRKNRQWSHFQNPNQANANSVFSIIEDSSGRVFSGTRAGLFILQDGVLKRFISGEFKIERIVYFIVEDRSRRLWFGTDNGVIRWDGKRAVKYSTSDGLIGLETNRAAGIVDSQGRVWIGTNRGVSVYNRSFDNMDFPSYPSPPKAQLLALETADGKIPLPAGEPIRLAFKQNTITFHFRAISFLDETRLRFRSKLVGLEDEWSEEAFPYNQLARYRNLGPGKYRFHLKVKNALGTWSEPVKSPEVIIRKPFYKTWWFYLFVLLLFGALSIVVHRYLVERRYFARLEEQVEERTEQLRMSEEKYSTLFQETKDMVYMSTLEGKLTDINPAGVELFGYASKQEILEVDIGRDLYANPEDRKTFQKEIQEKGYVKDYQLDVRRKDGKKLVVLMTVTAVRNKAGDVVAYRGIMRDITQQKEVEKQLERVKKMEAIGMLSGGVAHDLNNILSGLTSYPELLLMKIPEDSPLRRPLLTIKRTGEKAAAVVQDLLTLSRRGVALSEVVNLNDIVKDYLTSPGYEKLKSHHPEARFTIRTAPDLQQVMGSPIHLFKTLMNLVSNAVEAMPDGGWVRIKTENRYLHTLIDGFDNIPSGTYAVLSVSDTGVGISPDDISRIFEPFYTRKKLGRSGTGLGMSVVWATAKDHNGYIDINTRPGEGSTFELYFPVTDTKPTRKHSTISIDQYRGNEKILIVDDIEEQREVASKILSDLGYQVTAVASGEEAIEYMKTNSVDLLIIDMILENGINGLETYQRILDTHPRQKAIIVSGFSETDEVKKMQGLGAGIYIKKPYTIEQLGRAVRLELNPLAGGA